MNRHGPIPDSDDSGWSLLSADKGWHQQGYAGYGGVAWYRLAILLPAQHGPLALYIPKVDVSCQVFANGNLIGQVGGLPPQPQWISEGRILFPIPNDIANSSRLLRRPSLGANGGATALAGGLNPAPRIGDARAIAHGRMLDGREVYWRNSYSMVELFANVIGGLASLGFFVLRRKEREYLWFGVYLLNWSAYNAVVIYSAFRPVPHYAWEVLTYLLVGFGFYTGVEFYTALCGQARNWVYAVAAFFAISSSFALAANLFQPLHGWPAIFSWSQAGMWACLTAMVYRVWRAGNRDAGILMVAVAYSMPQAIIWAVACAPPS